MARKYDSSRREEAANRTREAILNAALKLHGEANVDYDALAEEANVSVATIRKHFPTREALFEGCTDWGLHLAPLPDLRLIESVEDPVERLRVAVRQCFGFYESLRGQMWTAHLFLVQSEVLRRVVAEQESLRAVVVEAVMKAWQPDGSSGEARGFVTGLMSFLTYRALRHDGGLSPEQTTARITEALLHGLDALLQKQGKETTNV